MKVRIQISNLIVENIILIFQFAIMKMEEICMFFYQSTEVVFLFKELSIKSTGSYI